MRILALRWFIHYGIRAYVLNENYHPAFALSYVLRFWRIADGGYSDFLLADLIRFAEQFPDKVLALVPGNTHYRDLIEENRTSLEKYYILTDQTLSFLTPTP